MPERVDSLLAELQARHSTQPEFMDQLRPLVERILADATPEDSRPRLLELVAETCERQTMIEKNSEAMRAAFDEMFRLMRLMIQRLSDGKTQ